MRVCSRFVISGITRITACVYFKPDRLLERLKASMISKTRRTVPVSGIFELHLSFQMASNTHELQSSMNFQENWFDVLTFISPIL